MWKGELLPQNVVSISETGGVYNPHLYGDEAEDKQAETVELAMEGVRVMQPGERYMLFVKYNDLIKEENIHYTLGIYQGKYRINGDQVECGASLGAEEKRFTFDSLDSLRVAVQKLKVE